MAEEKQNNLNEGDADATLLAPMFDEEAAETAQPVIPLASPPRSPRRNPIIVTTDPAQPPYAPVTAPRSWLLGLIVVSVLFGSVLGGLGLRFYQKRLRATVTPTASASSTHSAPVATAEEAQAAQIAPVGDVVSETSNEISSNEISVAVDTREDATTATSSENDTSTTADDEESVEDSRADDVERKPAVYDSEERPASKRDDVRREEPKKRARDESRAVREDSKPSLVGTIKPRRTEQPASRSAETAAPRRSERARDSGGRRARRERAEPPLTDRVRGIFEGSPRR